jgi:hypothetical protein
MLTAEEKQVIADKMGLEVFCDGRVYNYELHRFMRFDLNDAGLVRDWLVERGEWNNFILSLFDNEDVLSSISSWLFVTENGEAVNFFRSFVKWCEEGNR